MPKVHYIDPEGQERIVDINVGWSVMEGAVRNDIPGIDADCGGSCACATCHVYVDPAWLDKLPPRSEMEETMLDFAQDVAPNSRLSCQLEMSVELDGLVVRVPKTQHGF